MLVTASLDCFADLPLSEALGKLVDLEFTTIEMVVRETSTQLKPSQISDNLEQAVDICRKTQRLNVVSYDVQLDDTGEEHYRQFQDICRLAKATKVVHITVPSGPLVTPFNEEVERLRKLVAIAGSEGVIVSMKSQIGRFSEDPDTVGVLCDNVEGLGLTLDPSPYICGPYREKNTDSLMKYVCHVHLRDASPDAFQVRVGQGEVDYGRMINQLRRVDYRRALCVHIAKMEDLDHMAELRKMRRLLESLL